MNMDDRADLPTSDRGRLEDAVDDVLRQLMRVAEAAPLAALSIAARLECGARDGGAQAAFVAAGEGRSWSEIGAAYGITKQAAHQRFARRVHRMRKQGGDHR
ncbi:hypothetical protein ITI46_23475 [Streptomyces oryzae]|uniref:Uncharacterized protein n=1 Tax=Streptomyces oryzae TaxID=1434886 RepID=A0ABS3XGR8_9ACTN|nr:hypothetical protein [Streptomyces oryzae]MBO8194592.1 hypothetical protein [Streptomyces oryzae]